MVKLREIARATARRYQGQGTKQGQDFASRENTRETASLRGGSSREARALAAARGAVVPPRRPGNLAIASQGIALATAAKTGILASLHRADMLQARIFFISLI